MTDNQLGGAELKHLAAFPKLKIIKFGNNKVKTFEELEALVSDLLGA